MQGGKKVWYFPDGYLPEKTNNGEMEAHEALMLFNTNEQEADVLIDIYFSDKFKVMPTPAYVPDNPIKEKIGEKEPGWQRIYYDTGC